MKQIRIIKIKNNNDLEEIINNRISINQVQVNLYYKVYRKMMGKDTPVQKCSHIKMNLCQE